MNVDMTMFRMMLENNFHSERGFRNFPIPRYNAIEEY